jgi:1-deoxy-D-xylulose-5-phosphate reductoisomerase
MSFFAPDNNVFPSIEYARAAAKTGGSAPCIFNSANEACVELFLERKIRFGDIFALIEEALSNVKVVQNPSLSDILEADLSAREFVYKKADTFSVPT